MVCWLQVQYADALFAQNQGMISLKLGDYQQRRQGRAARRYLAAIKALAQVRRLLMPVVQVNVAQGPELNMACREPPDQPADLLDSLPEGAIRLSMGGAIADSAAAQSK